MPEAVVVAADTTVVIDGDILGKPADEAEARAMVRRLCGRTHTCYTGMAVRRAVGPSIVRRRRSSACA